MRAEAALRPPLIAVVTPVRNGERYLSSAIESVLAQTMADWEYLIVDGMSADRSRALAEAYAARDPRVRVLCQPDEGMYDGLLKGLAATRAPLCCWLNADDHLMPWAFELAARYRRLTGAEWLTGLPAAMDGDGLIHTIDSLHWYPRRLLRAGLFHGRALGFLQQEGTFFARRLLAQVEPASLERIRRTRQVGDFLLWTELARFTGVHLLPTVLGVFRLHGHNMTADMGIYYDELTRAGYHLPSAPVAAAMKACFLPMVLVWYKRRLRSWRAQVPRLPPLDPAPGPAPAAAEASAESEGRDGCWSAS